MDKRRLLTNNNSYLSQEELEGLAITQEQILDAYNAGTSDASSFSGTAKQTNVPAEHTDEDA